MVYSWRPGEANALRRDRQTQQAVHRLFSQATGAVPGDLSVAASLWPLNQPVGGPAFILGQIQAWLQLGALNRRG